MKRLFSYIYTAYCIIPFVASFFITIPLYFIIFNFWPRQTAPHVAHRLSRKWAAFLFYAFFIRIKIENKEKIQPAATYVFMANHLSLLDIPLYACACRNTFRFLAKAELTKIPLMGYVINNLYISVKRGDKNDRAVSLEKMKQSLDSGISVFLAPEGTRNRTEAPLLEFREGAFRLAIASQKPIALLAVFDTHKLLPPTGLVMQPGTIHASWCDPISTAGFTETDLPLLKEKARNSILEKITARRSQML